jgi:deoxyribose-phosphate aldolase
MEFNSKIFDHTCLNPFAKNEELKKLCSEAVKFNFKTVAINNAYIEYCKKELQGTKILIDAAVSFPLGQSTLETKVFETKDAIEKGAGEVDYVINIAQLKNKNYKYIEKEMSEIVEICRKENITSKVIFENCYLTDDEKILLCEIANNIKPDFIKTSTGFGISGATFEDVKLMRKHAKDYIKIKAAGGIKTKKDVLKYLDLGVSRIGCSSSVQIINE